MDEMTFDRNNPDVSMIDLKDDSITIAGHKFDVLGNAMNHEAHALMHRVLPYCKLPEHAGAMVEHAGYRWWFDSLARLDKVDSGHIIHCRYHVISA